MIPALFAMVLMMPQTTKPQTFHSFASTPPMGWNSWDCFGTSVTEEQFKANAIVLSRELRQVGYTVATVDIQWYEPDAGGFNYRPNANVALDPYGRLLPAVNRFPSAKDGKGFTTLAAWTHAQKLKFGVHLMRGIPRRAVEQNLPVFGTKYRAKDVANTSSVCDWNPDMYGVDVSKPGGQEYYNSVFQLLADWGVDFVKVDDLSRPYTKNRAEIEAIRKAIDRTGRKMVLSMSPGEAPVDEAIHATNHANMWRISDDFWDSWPALHEQFARLERWNAPSLMVSVRKDGAWPDADMLPLGWLQHGSRKTNFTLPEQQTLMTLWGIARSPLIIGADLSKADKELLDLLRQPDVIRMNQRGSRPRMVKSADGFVAWKTTIPRSKDEYLAIFNTLDAYSPEKGSALGEVIRVDRKSLSATFDVAVGSTEQLALITTDGGDGFVFDHSIWVNPRFVLADGSEVDATSLASVYTKVGYGAASTKVDPEGAPLALASRPGAKLLSVHAPSMVVLKVPQGAIQFKAEGTLSDKAVRESTGGTVDFFIRGYGKDSGASGAPLPDWAKALVPDDAESVWAHEGETIPWHGCQLYRIRRK